MRVCVHVCVCVCVCDMGSIVYAYTGCQLNPAFTWGQYSMYGCGVEKRQHLQCLHCPLSMNYSFSKSAEHLPVQSMHPTSCHPNG